MNLSELLKPLFLSATPLGLAPMRVKTIRSETGNRSQETAKTVVTAQTSIWSFTCFVIVVTFFMYVFTLEPVSDMYEFVDKGNVLKVGTDSLEAYMSAIAACTCIWCNFRNRHKLVQVINYLEFFDVSLQRHGLPAHLVDHAHYQLNIFVAIVVNYVWFFAAGYLERTNYMEESVAQWLMYVAPIIVTTLLITQFLVVSVLLKKRFNVLNAYLHLEQTDKRPGASTIDYVKELHMFLWAIADLVNEAYSKQILLIVMQSTVTIVASAFFLVNELLHRETVNESLLYLYSMLLFAFCLFQICSVIWAAITLPLEAKRTLYILFGKRVHFDDESLNSRMLFALQTADNQINFEICRGFPVDGSLLSNLVGTVTTYILIVIQFEINFYPVTDD